MTDHKAEAESLLAGREITLGGITGTTYSTRAPEFAQVHAALYLAEQQRVANLIALLPGLDNAVVVDRMDWDRPLPSERDNTMADIRKSLGLT